MKLNSAYCEWTADWKVSRAHSSPSDLIKTVAMRSFCIILNDLPALNIKILQKAVKYIAYICFFYIYSDRGLIPYV